MAFNLDFQGKPIPSLLPSGVEIVSLTNDTVNYRKPGGNAVATLSNSYLGKMFEQAKTEFEAGQNASNTSGEGGAAEQFKILQNPTEFVGPEPTVPTPTVNTPEETDALVRARNKSTQPPKPQPASGRTAGDGGIESVVINGRRVKVGSPAHQDALRGGVSPGISTSMGTSSGTSSGGSYDSGSIGEIDLSNPTDALAKISKGLQTFKEAEDLGLSTKGTVAETSQAIKNYKGLQQKHNLPDPEEGKTVFDNDPLKTISDITTSILDQMGFGSASVELENITSELEDLENERDGKIRDINDDPWLTEGVRLRKVQKLDAEYEDRINNRTNKLRLLQDVQSEARQAAQFAVGTAVSMWDSERKFQQDQLEFYYQQSQDAFENQVKLQQLASDERKAGQGTSGMQEYMFAIETGQFSGSFLDWKATEAAVTRAPSTGGGGIGNLKETQAEKSALGFYLRGKDAIDTIANIENKIRTKNLAGQVVLEFAPNWLQSDDNQVYRQLQRQFTEARLRKESGAAIPAAEYEADARTYFAQPGDSLATYQRKQNARNVVLESLRVSAGNAYSNYYGDGGPPATQTQTRQDYSEETNDLQFEEKGFFGKVFDFLF